MFTASARSNGRQLGESLVPQQTFCFSAVAAGRSWFSTKPTEALLAEMKTKTKCHSSTNDMREGEKTVMAAPPHT